MIDVTITELVEIAERLSVKSNAAPNATFEINHAIYQVVQLQRVIEVASLAAAHIASKAIHALNDNPPRIVK